MTEHPWGWVLGRYDFGMRIPEITWIPRKPGYSQHSKVPGYPPVYLLGSTRDPSPRLLLFLIGAAYLLHCEVSYDPSRPPMQSTPSQSTTQSSSQNQHHFSARSQKVMGVSDELRGGRRPILNVFVRKYARKKGGALRRRCLQFRAL